MEVETYSDTALHNNNLGLLFAILCPYSLLVVEVTGDLYHVISDTDDLHQGWTLHKFQFRVISDLETF